jgi:DNA anti-recombination protein RmuC
MDGTSSKGEASVINNDTLKKIKQADLANIIRKVKAGKPLSKGERELLEASTSQEEPKKRKGKKAEVSQVVDTMGAAASQMGYTVDALKAAKRAGCKAFKPGSRVDIFELEEWFALHPEITSVVDSKLTQKQAETMEKVNKALQRRDNYARQRRQLIHEDEMRRTFARSVIAAKNKMLSIPSSLCQTLAMLKDAHDIDERLSKAIRAGLNELSSSEWSKLTCPHCRKEIEA